MKDRNTLYKTNLGNYYGNVELYNIKEGYFISLDNWGSTAFYEISENTYNGIISDIKGGYIDICQKCYNTMNWYGSHECDNHIKSMLKDIGNASKR